MSLLETISKPDKRPIIATIVGEAGTGKSSLAASFPKPVFIRAEDGVGRISRKVETPDAFPPIRPIDDDNKAPADLWAQLTAILREDHDYQTLVIDSVTGLDTIFTASILARDGKAKGLNQAFGGYGNGLDALAAEHGRVRKAAGLINERRGMNVIFIAHADIETMRLPDVDDYGRYSLRLNKRAISHYVDNVDLVGYVRLQSALRGDDDERKKVISNGDREFVCYATAASVSKNGLGITDAIDFNEGDNPLAPYLGFDTTKPDDRPKPTRRRRAAEDEVDDDGE